jgi:chloramphenicol O-acetyltransferase type B
MNNKRVLRLSLIPLGLLLKIYELALDGSRDISNKLRFRNAIVDRGCCLDDQSNLGDSCHILEQALIINSTINKYSYIGRRSIIQNVDIGSFCSIANDVIIGLGSHPVDFFTTSPVFYKSINIFKKSYIEEDLEYTEYKRIRIGNDVWVGARVVVLDGVEIGDGAVVAANAVVTCDVEPYSIVGGVPARLIRKRFSDTKIERLLSTRWWEMPIERIVEGMNQLNEE